MMRLARCVLSVLVVAALTGCSSDGDGTADTGSSSTPTPSAAGTATPSAAGTATPSAGTGQPSSTTSSTAAASMAGLVPGRTIANVDGVRITFVPVTLRRQGKLAVLELTGRNEDTSDNANLANPLRGSGTRFDGVSLVDRVNAKRYVVARDSKDQCLCTSFAGGLVVKPGETGLVSAYFAAPPPGVDRIDVDVPGVGVFGDVPVG